MRASSSSKRPPLPSRYYTCDEVAGILGCSVQHVRTLARERKLPGVVHIGGIWRLRKDLIDALGTDGFGPADAETK